MTCPECNRTGSIQTVRGAKGGICECGTMVKAPAGRRWFKRRTLLQLVSVLSVNALYDVLKATLYRIVAPSPRVVQISAKAEGRATVTAQVIGVQGLASCFKAGGATIDQG